MTLDEVTQRHRPLAILALDNWRTAILEWLEDTYVDNLVVLPNKGFATVTKGKVLLSFGHDGRLEAKVSVRVTPGEWFSLNEVRLVRTAVVGEVPGGFVISPAAPSPRANEDFRSEFASFTARNYYEAACEAVRYLHEEEGAGVNVQIVEVPR